MLHTIWTPKSVLSAPFFNTLSLLVDVFCMPQYNLWKIYFSFYLLYSVVFSCRYCTFPQQLVLRLDAPARIRKIQFLSHHSMIGNSTNNIFIHYSNSQKTACNCGPDLFIWKLDFNMQIDLELKHCSACWCGSCSVWKNLLKFNFYINNICDSVLENQPRLPKLF